jgi:hypothetical protein
MSQPDSPLKFIDRIADVDDFVSFKLDIDTPEVELPIIYELMNNKTVAAKVDELFFELHFICEYM